MLNFRNTSMIFLVLLVLLGLFNQFYGFSANIYLLAFIPYVVCLGFFSFRICSGFFVNSFCELNSKKKEVVLTFDDGPHPETTPSILDILLKNNVKAHFFCVGKAVDKYPEIVARIHNEGHGIGLHSHSHSYFYDFWFSKAVQRDLEKNMLGIRQQTGVSTNLFRPPYGVTNPAIGIVVRRLNLKVIGWSIRSLDTTTKNREKIVNRIQRNLHSGGIILLHDHLEYAPKLLEEVLDMIEEQGYKIASLSTDENE